MKRKLKAEAKMQISYRLGTSPWKPKRIAREFNQHERKGGNVFGLLGRMMFCCSTRAEN